MIHPDHLRKDIIGPVLKSLGVWSKDAEELLLLTAAQESHLGKYLHQIGGPALGIYQMEPATHKDVWENYLKYKDDFAFEVQNWTVPSNHFENNEKSYPEALQLKGNLYYATAMARCFYLRFKEPLPDCSDVEGMARYYKEYWNTSLGAATIEEAISNYERLVL